MTRFTSASPVQTAVDPFDLYQPLRCIALLGNLNNDRWIVVTTDRLRLIRLRQVDFHALGNDRRGCHKDQQQHQQYVE